MLKSYFVPAEPTAQRAYFATLKHAAVEFLAALAAVKPSAEAKKLKARRELITAGAQLSRIFSEPSKGNSGTSRPGLISVPSCCSNWVAARGAECLDNCF